MPAACTPQPVFGIRRAAAAGAAAFFNKFLRVMFVCLSAMAAFFCWFSSTKADGISSQFQKTFAENYRIPAHNRSKKAERKHVQQRKHAMTQLQILPPTPCTSSSKTTK